MHVVDLSPEHQSLYFVCLDDWSEEIKEAGDHKARWYERMKERGLRVKLALNDDGAVGGMIQYLPIEQSTVAGRSLYFIPCIWVHGHKQGRGNQQGRGLGRALLEAAEGDAADQGALGMAAWGLMLPFWMKASWYRRHGYRKADRDGIALLLWKPFRPDAEPPRWVRARKQPEMAPGRVTVTACLTGWCPAQNVTFERARRVAAEFGEKVEFRAIDTSDRQTFQEWGRADVLFVDRKQVWTGPPVSSDKLRKLIARRVRALG
jgi:GNAT superfamily N-acetyltransferase